MSKTVYVNSEVVERIGASFVNEEVMLDFKAHAPGIVGAVFLFDTEEHAQAYADKPVFELNVIEHNGEKAAMQ